MPVLMVSETDRTRPFSSLCLDIASDGFQRSIRCSPRLLAVLSMIDVQNVVCALTLQSNQANGTDQHHLGVGLDVADTGYDQTKPENFMWLDQFCTYRWGPVTLPWPFILSTLTLTNTVHNRPFL